MIALIEISTSIGYYLLSKVCGRMAKKQSIRALKYLLETSTVDSKYHTVYDAKYTYWCIKLKIGKPKWYLRTLDTIRPDLKVSCFIRYERKIGDEMGAENTSDAYEVSQGWGRKKDEFIIKHNSCIELAIIKREKETWSFYPLSRSFSDYAFGNETYYITLVFTIEADGTKLIPKNTTAIPYIVNGRINEV